MTAIFEAIAAYTGSTSTGQYVSLLLFVLVVLYAEITVHRGVSVACSIFGLMAILHFIDPQLYTIAYNLLLQARQTMMAIFEPV